VLLIHNFVIQIFLQPKPRIFHMFFENVCLGGIYESLPGVILNMSACEMLRSGSPRPTAASFSVVRAQSPPPRCRSKTKLDVLKSFWTYQQNGCTNKFFRTSKNFAYVQHFFVRILFPYVQLLMFFCITPGGY
jgi:hypothetical protein